MLAEKNFSLTLLEVNVVWVRVEFPCVVFLTCGYLLHPGPTVLTHPPETCSQSIAGLKFHEHNEKVEEKLKETSMNKRLDFCKWVIKWVAALIQVNK
ncbi:hypothetical protein CEXT_355261 [Caerostris extrusa]|uniref:Uncharacterized protein n=1 Tax=Caerostris extrusa TaxID=172846 RepID=A0AAV4NVH3_CAEEX|nr:hypothetical protein CEXT_355261 [Caerostris extrusa]